MIREAEHSGFVLRAVLFGWLLALVFAGCKRETLRSEDISHVGISLSSATGSSGELLLGKEAQAFFIYVNSGHGWTLRIEPATSSWLSADQSGGIAGKSAIALRLSANNGDERTATLIAATADGREARLSIRQQGTGGVLPAGEHILGDPGLLECPRLSGGETNYFITHYVENGKIVNYSTEYDISKHNPRWSCYSVDDYTSKKSVNRTDPAPWAWDIAIPSVYEVGAVDFSRSGFSRGHICASEDRVFSREANVQTFLYSNIMPQRQSHNEGIWLRLEQLVRSWTRNGRFRDVVYVAKGGTIREDQIEGKLCNGRLPVPKYFWMAVLVKKGDGYKSLGFWSEHANPNPAGSLAGIAVSVKELERRTGIDFFHNLPDSTEVRVEAVDPGTELSAWPGL